MSGSERVAALRRARQRQARIEAATARAIRAHASVDRAMTARAVAAERHDDRVAKAEATASADTAQLARVCGSAEAAAEILGWTTRDVRRVVKELAAGGGEPAPVAGSRQGSARRGRRSPAADESGSADGHD